MSLYVDSSALVKLYVDEPESDLSTELVESDAVRLTGGHTVVEVRRSLAQLIPPGQLKRMKTAFESDLGGFSIVELDEATCELAASIAETTGVKSLDALHLGAARRGGGTSITFLTFDLRQAQAARTLGFTVVGA